MALKDMGLVPLIIDINDDIIQPLFAKEGDYRSRGISLQIVDKGKEIDTTGIIVEFLAKPRDGKVYVVKATPVDTTKGKYEIVYPSSILQPGVVKCEIRLVKMTDDEIDKIITTKSFNLKVFETIADEDIFEGIDIEPIVEILVQAAQNEEERIAAENERIQAENARKSSENTRELNEQTRIENENIRQSNEQIRQQNEAIRQQNEEERIDLYNALKDLDVSQYEQRLQEAENDIENLQGDLNSHLEDTNNPHNVTAEQIGAETPAGAQAKAEAAASDAIAYAYLYTEWLADGNFDGGAFIDGKNIISPNITNATLTDTAQLQDETGKRVGRFDAETISQEVYTDKGAAEITVPNFEINTGEQGAVTLSSQSSTTGKSANIFIRTGGRTPDDGNYNGEIKLQVWNGGIATSPHIWLKEVIDIYAPNGVNISGNLSANNVHIGSTVYQDRGFVYGNRSVRLQTDATVFAIYSEGNPVFAVRQDGTKVGGLVIKDNKKYYMSPVDSPRMLIQDIITDVKLTGEQQKVYLNPDFANIIDGYAVICGGNVEIIEKHKKYFVVKGTGICDFLIVGNRYDYKDKYWFPMKDEDAEDI